MADDETESAGSRNDKLIATKQKWAREGRLLTGTTAEPERDRLPPGQRRVRDSGREGREGSAAERQAAPKTPLSFA